MEGDSDDGPDELPDDKGEADATRESIYMQGTTLSSLCSMVCWWGNRCLFFDESEHHHSNLLGEGEQASQG